MTLIVHNTLTNKKEPFIPIHPGKVGIYLCGPTVYDFGHLGHGRSAVAFDVIRRYLEYLYGEKNVTFVTNYTDIDDKMIDRANRKGITVEALAHKIIPEYEKDYAALGIKKPTKQTKATEYIDQMIEIIRVLEKKGYAYTLKDGAYFEIEKFSPYGKLSNQKLNQLRAGARVNMDDQKKHPHDFVLWKKEKPGEPSWDSPWGKGRPGWHIECSAMSQSTLGQPFDIHGGGQDLIFPHHECEVAQSEAAYDIPFCNTWLHNGFITVDQEKMSKSLENFFTLKDILKKYEGKVVRYLFLTAHYRSPIEFNEDQLKQSKNALDRLSDFKINLLHYNHNPVTPHEELDSVIQNLLHEFKKAMNDDFDTPKALAALFEYVKHINTEMAQKKLSQKDTQKVLAAIETLDTVLGIFPNIDKELLPEFQKLIREREKARAEKNWSYADEIRNALLKKGIELEDTDSGTLWKKSDELGPKLIPNLPNITRAHQ